MSPLLPDPSRTQVSTANALAIRFAAAAWLCAAALLAGCGGGSTTPPVVTGVFTGYVGIDGIDNIGAGGEGGDGDGGFGVGGSLGRIREAVVDVFLQDGSLLGSAPMGSDGFVTVRPGKAYTGSLLVRLTSTASSTYFDEALQAWQTLPTGTVLRARVPSAHRHIGVTALTEAAASLLDGQPGSIDPADPQAIAAANATVLSQLNRFLPSDPGVTDITILPVLVDADTAANSVPDTPIGRYALLLAGLAEAGKAFNGGLAAPALSIATHLARDLTDGIIDDQDAAGQPLAPVNQLAYQTSSLSQTLEQGMATALFRLGEAGKPPTAAVCPATLVRNGETLALDGLAQATLTLSHCQYRNANNGLEPLVAIDRAPYTADDPPACAEPGPFVRQVLSTNQQGSFVALYSTSRQVSVAIDLPDVDTVSATVLSDVVGQQSGLACP